MNRLDNLSKKFGFTKTETSVILFIISSFVAGLIVDVYRTKSNSHNYLEFDYKSQDSLFEASVEAETGDTAADMGDKKIDSKQKLSDFSKRNRIKPDRLKTSQTTTVININSAPVPELMKISGLGEKVASNIAAYRNRFGFFKRKKDIMLVKGIGRKRYDKIKDIITVSDSAK